MSTATALVACLGECMLELRETAPKRLELGYAGDTYNTAYYLAGSGSPVRVEFATVLGTDFRSDDMVRTFERHGVGARWIARDPGRIPGLYLINVDEHGERSFTYYRSASAARTLFSAAYDDRFGEEIAHADVIYLSGITVSILSPAARERLLDRLEEARVIGARVVFDSNYRAQGWPSVHEARRVTEQVYRLTDIALPSHSDERALYDDDDPAATAARIRGYGVGEIVVKEGADPGLWVAEDGTSGTFSPERVDRVVDTTGAGDSFNGGFLAARLAGFDTAEACARASHLAATVTGHRGAIIEPAPRIVG